MSDDREIPTATREPEPREDDAPPASTLYRYLSDGTPWGFVIVSSDGRLLEHNARVGALFGLDPAALDAVRALGRTVAARRQLGLALSAKALRPGTVPCDPVGQADGTTEEIALADGRVLARQVAVVDGDDGRPAGRIAFFRDVSRRRRAEQELRDRVRKEAALAALGELAVNAEQLEPLLQAACATVVDMLGVDAAALLEKTTDGLELRAAAGLPQGLTELRVAVGPEREELALSLGAVLCGGADGGPAPLLGAHGFVAAAEVALPGRERPSGVLGAYARAPRVFSADEVRFLETTASVLASALARRQAEAEVFEGERQMRAVFDNALDAMVIADDAGVVRDANPAAYALLGARRAAVLGTNVLDLAPGLRPAARPWSELLRAVAAGGGRSSGETEVALPGHRPRAVEYAIVASILPGRHLGLMRDVTERKQLHARLALADRMVSVGTLAAGVAHELNNPLAYVNANLAFIAERFGRVEALLGRSPGTSPGDAQLPAQIVEAVRDARDGAERMRVIIRDLKTFSRADEDTTGPVELRSVIESCVNIGWNEIRHRARLVKDLAPVPPVRANEARLGQVFLNLLVNAAQAIPEGNADANEIRIATRTSPDGRAVVEVRDTGCGIPAEHLTRMFDPFFTTKPPGFGTGLGLAICHSIVSGLGGEIEVESAVGAGSTFRVVLPASAPERAADPAAASPAVAARGRILVVDDEPLVGTVLQRTLQGEHDVTVVSSARAALARLDAGDHFDVVLSDLLMPEMTGMDLYREVARKDPPLARRMVFLTGGAFTPAARMFLEREPVVCVEKPFELETIRAVLARKLAERTGGSPG